MCDTVEGGAQCKETANSFAGMTAMFGKSFHDNGMREACDCVSEEEAPARFNEYVKHMYTEYNAQGLAAVPSVDACKEKECTADEKIEALVNKYSVDKAGKKKHPGKLFWKLVNTCVLRNKSSPSTEPCVFGSDIQLNLRPNLAPEFSSPIGAQSALLTGAETRAQGAEFSEE